MCICQLMSDRKNIIIEACIGIKIFTWTLVLVFTIPLVFLIITIIKYSDYSPVYFYVIICIVLINFGLLSEMLGTKIIISYDSIIIVKRFFQKNEIKIKDISGYKITFMTCVKGEYPDNLKIYHKNLETNFNKGLCSKKDMQKLYSFFETNSIIRIK